MMFGILAVALALLLPRPTAAQERSFDLRVVVDRSPAEVVRDWTTESTLDRFMGVSSNVQPRVKGAYEIRFRPGDDAESRANSTIGARILALEEGRHLAFEWRLPPWTEEPARSAPPTRVDVWVTPGDGHPAAGGTILHLRHSGFGHGASWDPVHDFFQWSWFEVLARYQDLASSGGP